MWCTEMRRNRAEPSTVGASRRQNPRVAESDAPLLVLGAGYLGAVLAGQALDAGHEVVLADNWYATDRGQLAGLEARGATVETVDIRSREEVEQMLALEPSRVFLLAAQASRPRLRARARLHRGDERDRRAPRRRADPRARRVRELAARVRNGAQRRGRPGHAVRAAGRSRAPLEDLRGARPRDARAARRLRAGAHAARDRLRAEPRRARPARVADGRGQVPQARGRRRAAPGRRRRRGDRRRPRRGRGADPARGRALRDRRVQRRGRDRDRRRHRCARAGRRRRARRPTFATRARSSTGTRSRSTCAP